MYSAKPLGINIKDNDRSVPDEYLQECINMQIRDGSFRPIPERIISDINVAQYKHIILHKVSDENTINVLGFKWFTPNYLAKNIAFNLGGTLDATQYLYWFGTITDGVYAEITPVNLGLAYTPGMSYTILNGIIYFMGDGSSTTEQYYYQYQYNDTTGEYESSDMYAWKSLIPFYPIPVAIQLSAPKSAVNLFTTCGVTCVRTALVLKSGEVVLHSPIYSYVLCGINRSSDTIPIGTPIDNIHTFINLNFEFADNNLFEQEISAINIYSTIPYYEYELTKTYSAESGKDELVTNKSAIGEIQKQAEQPFYLVKTIDKPSDLNILLTVGQIDADIELPEDSYKIDVSTIATGELMPVDNFTYHKIYGKITSYNGRIIIDSPITVLGEGHNRSLALSASSSHVGFMIDSEDGKIESMSHVIDKSFFYVTNLFYSRGILSYPDSRATVAGGTDAVLGGITSSSINTGGVGYLIGDELTVTGGSGDAKITATSIEGGINTAIITDAGLGYTYSDAITVQAGDNNAILVVTAVDGAGAVVSFSIEDEGTGYTISANETTTGGTGAGFEIGILSVVGAITAYNVDNKGSGYSVSSDVNTTTGSGGTGFKINILAIGGGEIKLMKLKKNASHNLACAFNINSVSLNSATISTDSTDVNTQINYSCYFEYAEPDELSSSSTEKAKYSSSNRLQFTATGEFSVWPAINSYRIGEGMIKSVGANVVNISSTDVIAPLIVGTTDGIYTINLDPSGNNLVSSITRAVNMPYLSRETLQISDQLIFISDKGLFAFNNGDPVNLTKPFFPDRGNGNFPVNETVLANYNRLTERYFNFTGNPYLLDDIINYLKGCLLAYDERRNSIWCSNSDYNFSLVYDIENKSWTFSELVFNEKIELFSTINAGGEDIYSRYLLRKNDLVNNNLLVHSGEDMDTEVNFHILTRPIKFQNISAYKKIERMFVRCELIKNTSDGFFSFGMWGKQDLSKSKTGIPINAIIGGDTVFNDNVRQDIPIGTHKGKYKSVVILLGGKALPESSVDGFEFDVYLVNENKLR